jgi:O-antigen ligase
MSKIFIKFNIYTIVKLLFYLFPFFMLLESALITSYVTLFLITTLFLFYSKKIRIKFDNIDYLLVIFFLLGFIAAMINVTILGKLSLLKSITDFRFLFFFVLIRNLINYKIVNLKFIFLVSLFCTSFLSLDIIYQHLNNKDFFGNTPFDGRFNGTFGHEAIAGGYIQKNFALSLCAIFLLTIKYQKKNLLFLVTTMLGLGILLSLDRMPFIIYLFTIILLIFFLKNYRLLFIFNFVIILIIFIFLFNNYKILNDRYFSLSSELNFNKFSNFFLTNSNEIIKKDIIEIKNDNYLIGDYSKIYKTSYYVWLKNPILGSGKRSFGKICDSVKIYRSNILCSTHPHNIYLEVVVTHGVLGLITFLTFIIISFYNIKKKIFTFNNNYYYIISSLFLTILFSELFPLRSYGSIFQTVNGTMFWFILALINSSIYKLK